MAPLITNEPESKSFRFLVECDDEKYQVNLSGDIKSCGQIVDLVKNICDKKEKDPWKNFLKDNGGTIVDMIIISSIMMLFYNLGYRDGLDDR